MDEKGFGMILKQKEEKRITQDPRFIMHLPVAILRGETISQFQEITGILEDLSQSGMKVSVIDKVDLVPGENLFATITLPKEVNPFTSGENEERMLSLRAQVIWYNGKQLGLKVLRVNEPDEGLYDQLIEKISKKPL